MMQSQIEIVTKLRQARQVQADAKEKALAAQREYDSAKALAYLGTDGTHYKAVNHATLAPSVVRARVALDDAEMAHYRAWSECNLLVMELSAQRGDSAILRDEWVNNKPEQEGGS